MNPLLTTKVSTTAPQTARAADPKQTTDSGETSGSEDTEDVNAFGNFFRATDDAAESKIDVPPQLCLLYTSPSPRDQRGSRMPSSA